ncbi:hypothetical protein K402DRAFT_343350 [Aulographum hederae CBS 113979]|uniref:DUF1254-domain-containing protein n=1 Tax=Aulographum hederae CBS 113979 TaxID=1176131 RepID=A0A6G1GJS7_9PEZI|nr:hypothetical protein K402DRAFT_343350 [Aulographum hederae CBS 113979]
MIAQNATAFALMYGYPLLAFRQFAEGLVDGVGINAFEHGRRFLRPEDRSVVKPNVDTLYSSAVYDLSESNLVIDLPNIHTDQYHLFSYYDPYGNNFANTGTGNLHIGGRFLLRPTPDGGTYGVDTRQHETKFQGAINSPTLYGIFEIRWLVQNSSSLAQIHAWQNATRIIPLKRLAINQARPTLQETSQKVFNPKNSVESVLMLLAAYHVANPPEVQEDLDDVTRMLGQAGIVDESFNPRDIDYSVANKTALAKVFGSVTQPGIIVPMSNGWSVVNSSAIGDYREKYALRAAVSIGGYLALSKPNAIYPTWSNSSTGGVVSPLAGGTTSIGPNESLLYTFSRKPPLLETGFWSLTIYQDNFLIPNPRDVYAVGDRSNLTYPDGLFVYGANASIEDKPFQILVQASDNEPPANWTGNWLPAPAGGGAIQLLLRWYGAADALSDGTYVYPLVTRQAATRAGNNTKRDEDAEADTSLGSKAVKIEISQLFLAIWILLVFALSN